MSVGRLLVCVGLLLCWTAPSLAAEGGHKKAHLVISDAFARSTPAGAQSTTVYMNITNTGSVTEKLVGADSAMAERVELHKIMQDHGLRRMHEVEEIEIPAHTTVPLKFGTYHIMLIGLKRPLIKDERVTVTLHFTEAGRIVLKAPVVDIKARKKALAGSAQRRD